MQKSGPLMVGSPQQIIDKIMYFYELFQQTRYLAQLIGGHLVPHKKILRAIELFGTEVAPVIRKEMASRQTV
ncbi:hypothetical protein [Siphonobacter sp. BAB-5385]